MTGAAAHCGYCIDEEWTLHQRLADYLDGLDPMRLICMYGDCGANNIVEELRAILAGAL